MSTQPSPIQKPWTTRTRIAVGAAGAVLLAGSIGIIYAVTQCSPPPSSSPPPTPTPYVAPAPTPVPPPLPTATATPFPPTPIPTLEQIAAATPVPHPAPTAAPSPTATSVPPSTALPAPAPAPTATSVPPPTPAFRVTATPRPTATPNLEVELSAYFNSLVGMAEKQKQIVGVAFYKDNVNGFYAAVLYHRANDPTGKVDPALSGSRTFKFTDARTLGNFATVLGATALPQSPLPTTPVPGGGSMAAYSAPSVDSTRDGFGQKVIDALKTQQRRIIQAIKDGGSYVQPK